MANRVWGNSVSDSEQRVRAAVWVVRDDTADGLLGYGLREIERVVERDCSDVVVVEDDSKLEHSTNRASEVVRITTLDIPLSVYGRLCTFLPSTQHFESVELAAAS